MKIVKVGLNMPYYYGEKENKTEQDKEKVIAVLVDMQIKHDPQDPREFFCTAEQAVEVISLFPHKYNEVYVETVNTVFDAVAEMREQLDAVLNRMNVAAARLEVQQAIEMPDECNPGHRAGGAGWNQHAAAPLSGPVLHSFNEVMLCEDYCTDALQGRLNEGWRLVAICPQESRRPDYVLGRYTMVNPPHAAQRG